jgi:hypothetical protein
MCVGPQAPCGEPLMHPCITAPFKSSPALVDAQKQGNRRARQQLGKESQCSGMSLIDPGLIAVVHLI